ncbi:MAG: DUF3098 domain-containing protein [Muribaculaceae bacterium]|nr:DUF3098 domain-containing protein [Muribaculaceae bacterium]
MADIKQPKLEKDKNIDKIKYNVFPLDKWNFILMAVFGLMIIVGFLLMTGSPSSDTFNPEIFSTRRIVVGPTLAFLGFMLMAFAIMYSKKKTKKD